MSLQNINIIYFNINIFFYKIKIFNTNQKIIENYKLNLYIVNKLKEILS